MLVCNSFNCPNEIKFINIPFRSSGAGKINKGKAFIFIASTKEKACGSSTQNIKITKNMILKMVIIFTAFTWVVIPESIFDIFLECG